jgi:DNA polymerase V
MGDVARCSIQNEELLYQLFGINAELLIDHAWGWEPCTIADVKAYRPETKSIVSGQVLQCPYAYGKAKLVSWEMADALALELVEKRLVTDQLVLTIGYDIENLSNPQLRNLYKGPVTTDRYGRQVPKHAHGTINLKRYTSSAKLITQAIEELFGRIVAPDLLVRRISITANRLQEESAVSRQESVEQLDLFTDYAAAELQRKAEEADLDRERRIQETMLTIKKKFGKNAILKGSNLEEGATARSRNQQIGGHRA